MEDDRIDQINNTIDEMVTILEGIVEENGQYEDAHVMTQKMEALMASLQESLTIQAEQPVVICDGEKLMNAGIALYNASRKAFKIREGEIVLHILVLPRFLAARTMKLALTFESGGNHNTENIQPSYLDQCLDVLRAFGRVGCLMMECAKKELDKSQHFLSLAVECLEGVTRIWSQIGLSYLTHLKCRSELEEVLQEIWDFFITRIKVLGIIEDTQKGTEGNDSVSGILDSLQELRVLVPYLSAYANDLVEVITAHIDALHSQGKYDLESILAEESLRVADTLEIIDQPLDDGILQRFRSHLLLRLLDSVAALGDIERAEACFSLLPPGRESVSLLVMLRLYLRKQLMEKAISCVRKLLQQGDVTHATKGVEAYVQAQNFSEESLKLYDDLQRCFGDNAFEIKLSLAENLAYSNSRKNRQSALSLIQSILEMLHDRYNSSA
jgi:tetratricopeptide (TPR) repeat protein